MELLKKHINFKSSSLLESVVSLSIISICLYVTIIVYTTIFNEKTSVNYHVLTLKSYQVFYDLQTEKNNDSIIDGFMFEEEWISTDLRKIKLSFKDSTGNHHIRKYYVQN